LVVLVLTKHALFNKFLLCKYSFQLITTCHQRHNATKPMSHLHCPSTKDHPTHSKHEASDSEPCLLMSLCLCLFFLNLSFTIGPPCLFFLGPVEWAEWRVAHDFLIKLLQVDVSPHCPALEEHPTQNVNHTRNKVFGGRPRSISTTKRVKQGVLGQGLFFGFWETGRHVCFAPEYVFSSLFFRKKEKKIKSLKIMVERPRSRCTRRDFTMVSAASLNFVYAKTLDQLIFKAWPPWGKVSFRSWEPFHTQDIVFGGRPRSISTIKRVRQGVLGQGLFFRFWTFGKGSPCLFCTRHVFFVTFLEKKKRKPKASKSRWARRRCTRRDLTLFPWELAIRGARSHFNLATQDIVLVDVLGRFRR
jgi:hypothetical protein